MASSSLGLDERERLGIADATRGIVMELRNEVNVVKINDGDNGREYVVKTVAVSTSASVIRA